MIELSKEDAQNLVLEVQGLRTAKPCKSAMDVAHRIHNIQIDTISVVSRSHNLITYNRFPNYKEGDVWKLERKGKLFEYWSHAMCMMPVSTFPYYAWKMARMRERKKGWYVEWALENKDLVDAVYKKVKKDGVTRSKDLGEKNRKSNGWWDWKKEKRALESLMTHGRLMVAYREGFQKAYDIPERVIPAGIDTEPMSEDEVARFVVDTTFRSLGIADYRDVKWYTGGMVSKHFWNGQRNAIEEYLSSLVGDLLEEVDFGQKGQYFIYRKFRKKAESIVAISDNNPVKFLTPFDNILRERHYPKAIWDFDYKIECYVPAPDRVHGYFVLPILDQNELRGRVDAKVHRKTGVLELKSLYLEHDELKSDEGIQRLVSGVKEFAKFHGCESIELTTVSPKKLKSKIVAAFDS
ncbi:MAG: winged helix-turn-helix domain-containing protein [Candidatus Thorarchaeota archaeon]|jgi:uncharacterized protein YcaQ